MPDESAVDDAQSGKLQALLATGPSGTLGLVMAGVATWRLKWLDSLENGDN